MIDSENNAVCVQYLQHLPPKEFQSRLETS